MAARKTKPQGRKSDKCFRDALLLAVNRDIKDPDTGKKVKRLHLIADRLSRRATEDTVSAREVANRLDGLPTQQINLRKIGSFEDLTDEELANLARE